MTTHLAGEGNDVLLALDIGTGGAHLHAYSLDGELLAYAQADYPVYYDRAAWAEQDPEAWWESAQAALRDCLEQLDAKVRHYYRPCGIGLTGQSPTIAPFDQNMQPLRRGILYQDNRAVSEADQWADYFGGRELVHERTGHSPSAFYIGPKILWVRRHEPQVFAHTSVWLQPRDFIAFQLTGRNATDWSHAGSTLLFDINSRTWASDYLRALDLSEEAFPPALPPWTILGELRGDISASLGLPVGLPVVLGGADSQCCTVGAGALRVGELSDMAGTSTCLNSPVEAPLADLRVANYCHVVPQQWCTELGLNASGAAFEWLVSLLASPGQAPDFATIEAAAAQSSPGASDLLFLPYMADGERFDPSLRGGFYGLSLRHTRGDLARSVLEGVAFAIREHLETMAQAGAPVREMYVSGGGGRSALWNQVKATITGIPVSTVKSDATALGVALVAGTAIGFYPSLEAAVHRCSHISDRYEPQSALADLYTARYHRFRQLAQATAEKRDEVR
jgi:xylulokinase